MKILIIGCAGFIGSHLTDKLLSEGYQVVGVDNFNDYYDPKTKESNLKDALKHKNFKLYRQDILNFGELKKIFEEEKPGKVVHLAARAGVRPSIADPLLYSQVNVGGTVNLLKLSVDFKVKQFIFGSSSSVYGNSKRLPFSENDLCDTIISPYGASKMAAEFWVESFYHTFGLKSIILRFFTVYGPRGRPDMAPALFTKATLEDKKIKQFGDGSTARDYTYIDDIIDGILKAIGKYFDFEVINLGNNHPVSLNELIGTLEKTVNKKAIIEQAPNQKGDVEKTWANIEKAKKLLNWAPKTSISLGLKKYHNFLVN
ncbi:hypothetical protein A3A54_01110 [Candidatus Curtissbacteria bacterium RIFCSPLOWO2_01_FULL_39_62]|uniref:NAD(P)-binding domain-containing protein n=1 Tax=Candidatus Curtissbacteria bacterium RIFCSPLOWO2_12_FULL_38_9 TaxID=1797735 RepID=A0A1F5IAQ8_9BACT|nr:MAG: hypothetical protein A2775_01605 [Candidatus Curtissbacteria bacterium RIFCSPHIGHO2_01_FULL_39_57]OGD89922.1 MAG: hypothetical protein A3E11_02320 [Candidatus Curtissbacteria bacterium RIFCSPHIGHO2_12_FULL_38_37]OGE02366.1 MAG: hypothetical protein A3A54_01110 [Candidatus Curtissbacteria bacterium RIFCSPLOWO2_01_FULL_39_62]OGE13435.1 MAG: hypothetical protein A3G14_05300 [Candidatus Curtissbacteria bacterium RIFCSPLOWO2_12_FULL_38_9]